MASEIRVNKINSRTGVGTITLSPTGVDFTGIATVATLKATTGIVTTLSVTGTTTLNGNLDLQDNDKILVGTGDDLEIYHNGSTSFITDSIGDFRIRGDAVKIQSSGGENSAQFVADGAAKLYYDNSQKLETTGVGASVTGTFNVGTGTSITSSSLIVNDVQYPTAGAMSNRNLIINGAMQIAQRGDDFQPPASGDYTLDRFQAYMSSSDAYDVQRVTDTPSGQGFKNSLKVTSNAATSIAAGGYYYLGQRIEGNNWVQMGYGASGAKTCTVSFWVKSSLTGTHSGILKNSDQNRSLAFEYTISSANTWEYKQITITGDTSGTWLTGNGTGVWVYFSMGVGTTFATGTADTWQATNLVGTTSSVDVVATSGATWFLTGLQVEHGDKATPFEFKIYGDELARCQRYYQRASASSGSAYARCIPLGHMATNNILRVVVPLHPPMRSQPSFNFSGSFATQPNVGTPGLSLETSNSAGGESVTLVDSSSISGTVGNCISIAASNDDDAYMEFSAEL